MWHKASKFLATDLRGLSRIFSKGLSVLIRENLWLCCFGSVVRRFGRVLNAEC
jgi:hypothetical protein